MKIEFIPLDYDHVDVNSKAIIRIFGRTADGKRCCILDSCDAFFWLLPKKGVDLEKYASKVEKIKVEHAGRTASVKDVKILEKNYLCKKIKALKVFVNNPKDISVIKDIAKNFPETAEKKEIDINFVTRYIIEKKIGPLTWYDVEGQLVEDYNEQIDLVIRAEKINEINGARQKEFLPKVLAFDIETSEFEIGKGKILMMSLTSDKFKKIITWKKTTKALKEIEFVRDEAELLEKFVEIVKKEKPDILTGYFSDGFDLPYLRARADLHKIKLPLGLDNSNITFVKGRVSSARITGIVHIDLFKFVNNIIAYTLKSETLNLDEVASELIGEKKVKLEFEKTKEGKEGFDSRQLIEYFKYNLQDALLAEKLFYKLWPNILELTKIVQEPLWHASRASYSQLVESYIIHNLDRFNEIAPNRPTREKIEERRKRPRYIGAFVFQPQAALYENIAVFDFTSFYPSIIVSFNISPATIKEKDHNCYATPEFEFEGKKKKFYFEKKPGFMPLLLKELVNKRKILKENLKKKYSTLLEARSYALKTLSNAFYGYHGFFGARWYSVECAASIAAFARQYIHRMIDETNKKGFKVIYADTDGYALSLQDKKKKDALDFLKKINKNLPGTIELELENFYTRGIFVTKRAGVMGAKKKYAMLSEDGKIKIRGFETVRRDWCDLAKQVQNTILQNILKEGNANSSLRYLKKIIAEIKKKKIEKKKLLIRTQLKKAITEYEAIGPHVVVAKKMLARGIPVGAGSLIEYFVARGKKKGSIGERAKLPEEKGEYDVDYYINHQILPAVENIFAVFGIEKDELLGGQKKLGEF